ncbi:MULTISPECIES: Tc toxin subunit A [unclassified Pseudomonas]|uniref:Tc toxin subunit A n=1 Tax=unclassified Pseudomonas TaxID=196821 RepID=UPI00166075F5|nr:MULTISPECIES: Tc toxin subunit A [unclassified Pseudomonas]MBD0706829.1 virulence plasmid 28 protein [Pseudomonas sp. PSB1]MDR8389339.1 Tc toxin subunit A [Pseudomonas sp. JL2]
MADSRPALQLLNQVFSDQQLTHYATLHTYLEEGGSIFTLVEKGVQGLVRDFGVSADDARQLLRRLNSMAIYLRRQFIEHTLYGSAKEQRRASSGLLSMVQGPSFELLFNPQFDSLCPPQALESFASPVAYLIELMRWIEQRIEAVSSDTSKLPLHDRRKDLKPLSIDFNAVHQSVSSVDIIVPVLEKFIGLLPEELEQAMIEARYPNGLPYFQHWVTVDTVARHHGLSVGSFAQSVSPSFPYFFQTQAWYSDVGPALAHASRLGPYQRRLLTEPPVASANRTAFYLENFGAGEGVWEDLDQVPFFGERTKLDTLGLEALLSVRGFAPARSANVTYPSQTVPEEPESGRSGSVYLNANTHPAVHITGSEEGDSFSHELSVSPGDAVGLARFDRMNRKLRLDQWLALPSEQVDALLVAAIKAEVRGGAPADNWWITEQVVHALGLFQSLRERCECPVNDFAVFIDELSIYGRGEALSQFDQLFNGQGDYRDPLKLDGGTFPIVPAPEVPDLTVSQLCSALGIDLQTYNYLALAIANAHGIDGDSLPRNLAIVSSFYRMVKLPRLLGITPVEGVLLLTVLGGELWLNGLAGVPRINSTTSDSPDVLNLIQAMQLCVDWCADHDLPVLWMVQQVSPPSVLDASRDAEGRLFEQLLNLLPGALLTHSAILMGGVPAMAGASWLELLGMQTTLVESDGLVMSRTGTEAQYLDFARRQLDYAVTIGLGEQYELERPAIVERLLAVVLEARDAQVSVVKECLAVYTGIGSEQALEVLAWANSTVSRLLRLVLERDLSHLEGSVKRRNALADPLLALLADVRRRSAVVAKLELSAEVLRDYLDYGHKAWLDQDDKHAFTVRTLYYLTTLNRAFELSDQPAQTLLDYLREVNALPSPIGGHALRLAEQAASIRLAGFFDWSVQEVRECVSRLESAQKILKNLPQLDLLMRVRVLAARTSMDALTIFLMGGLPEEINKPAYKAAAEHALLSLSESDRPLVTFTGDLKQLVTVTCVPDNTVVVAAPDEKITFIVTLMDSDGNPLSGVNVYWSAELGTIETKATETNGVVEAEYRPGKVTGWDTPQFWLDLFEREYAPTVQVIFDKLHIAIPRQYMSPVPLETVPLGQEVELYAVIQDIHGNLAKNHPTRWLTVAMGGGGGTVVYRPDQSYTNQEGLARTFVSSPTGGRFLITVAPDGGKTADFPTITFESEEQVP